MLYYLRGVIIEIRRLCQKFGVIMEDEIKIEAASPELLEEAIKTLPFKPVYFVISMLAGGISDPGYKEKGGEERYLSECSINNVIPNSQVSFVYNSKAGLFVPRSSGNSMIRFYESSSDDMIDATVQKLLKGGRIHKIEVKAEEIPSPVFPNFRDTFLPMLLECGYQLREGDLWLDAGYSRQEYSVGGYYRNGGLAFGIYRGAGKGLELQLHSKVSDDCREILTDWFSNLENEFK